MQDDAKLSQSIPSINNINIKRQVAYFLSGSLYQEADCYHYNYKLHKSQVFI